MLLKDSLKNKANFKIVLKNFSSGINDPSKPKNIASTKIL